MNELRAFLAEFIHNSDIVDLSLAALVMVFASRILGTLGFDIFKK